MNVLFSIINHVNTLELSRRLIKRYNSTQACIITTDLLLEEASKVHPDAYIYDQANNTKADYSDCALYNSCPPVDKKLLDSMSKHEPIIMKMFERQERTERHLCYDERVRRYHVHLRYWNHMLEAAEIEVAVFVRTPHMIWDYIIFCLCKLKGIAVAYPFIVPGADDYGYFSSDIETQGHEVLEHYNALSEKYKDTPIDDIELSADFQKIFDVQTGKDSSNKTPYYMKNYSGVSFLIHRIKNFPGKVRQRGISHIKRAFLSLTVNKSFEKTRYFKTRTRKLFREYDKLSSPADFNKSYIYLPLHYQPENTTSPMGGYFVHQLLVAQMLSFYLPDNISIYVKENPKQTACCRDSTLYHDLVKLPNVVLVDRKTDTYKLLEHCIAVASCTGTAGFEGMFIGKPNLMFGYYINMYAPGTFMIHNNEDCKDAIENILQHGTKFTLKDMKLYLKALSEVSTKCMIRFIDPRDIFDEDKCNNLEIGLTGVIDKQISNSLEMEQK